MLICNHTPSSDKADNAPSSPPAASATASASASIVSTNPAPSAASAGLSATVAPSSASGSAFSRERFQARTSNPAASKLRAIAAPMIPVPRTAIALSFAICVYVSLLGTYGSYEAKVALMPDRGAS